MPEGRGADRVDLGAAERFLERAPHGLDHLVGIGGLVLPGHDLSARLAVLLVHKCTNRRGSDVEREHTNHLRDDTQTMKTSLIDASGTRLNLREWAAGSALTF